MKINSEVLICPRFLAGVACLWLIGCSLGPKDLPMVPRMVGGSWTVAHNPDLGKYSSPKQQPVDFGVWQAADGTWQLWSCIRHTKCGGNTRLFYRWEGQNLTDPDWKPMGIAMEADPKYGESPGGLQAPHVIKIDGVYHMFYGSWTTICLSRSTEGKKFTRWLYPNGKANMFTEGPTAGTRDPMIIRIDDKWYCYYTAAHGEKGSRKGSVYCRTSTDLRNWSNSKIVAFGGQAGTGPTQAECPHVVKHRGYYYLFRTQRYGPKSKTSIYRSKDPMDFGINDDKYLICTMPIAAPEIIFHNHECYIAHLLPNLKGIQINRLTWVPEND
ncbi:MAG: family 43 glycosylhydrolase [Planctomycetota bacterium]|nr:MAG: family 43 glycosylhydrolase [Planctomycetota bacterium]